MANSIHFGTDGWRAIIREDFTEDNLIKVVDAASQVFQEKAQMLGKKAEDCVLYVGHDCRLDAHTYAQLAAEVAAARGFRVKLTQDYCPTPALCWAVSRDEDAVGGIMLTSSHNPAEYLGVKLRMEDGGASSKEFTDQVESLIGDEVAQGRGSYEVHDLVSPYLEQLTSCVDVEAIKNSGLRVVVDPMFGAGRLYLAQLMEKLGLEVVEINNIEDPSFDGLHPEPIPPWINRALSRVKELSFDAGFITDGDADRIGAVDDEGNFVNPHTIITLLVSHLYENKNQRGRVVSTITASSLLARQCERLNLELTLMPVGFKWIYGEMKKGDVMIGGEESGGIGIPSHLKERDGLLMALLLTEMMAQNKKSLKDLVGEMHEKIGKFEFMRRGLQISPRQMEYLRKETIPHHAEEYIAGKKVLGIDRLDGIKFNLENDAWVMMRPSGTEPIVRIYAEAPTMEEVEELLNEAEQLVLYGSTTHEGS